MERRRFEGDPADSQGPRALAWDRRAGTTLTRELKRHGVNIITRASVTHVDTGANLGATVHYTREGQDGEQSVWGEIALVAIGRDPITDPAWGVTIDDPGHVATDAYGRTDKPGVWAVGDVTAGHALAHRAFEQGIVIAETIAGLNPKPVEEATMPQIVFSFPKRRRSGSPSNRRRREEDLIDVKETNYPMLANARMLMSGTAGSLTIVSGCDAANPDTPRVLGVHMVPRWPPTSSPKPNSWSATMCRSPTQPASFTRIPRSVKRSARRCSRPTDDRCTHARPTSTSKFGPAHLIRCCPVCFVPTKEEVMAEKDAKPKKQSTIKQIIQIYKYTAKEDKALP